VARPPPLFGRLRRDLGSLESYAAMIGMLVGAGVFRVTGVASEETGPGVILGYLLLAPTVLATSVAYMVYLSTPLGEEPGGEYADVLHTFGSRRLAFLCAWLKLISYLGALAFLARALADYAVELAVVLGFERLHGVPGETGRLVLALLALFFFLGVHVVGVRWFGRLQVGMCAILGLSILVLVVPGLFAIEPRNYRPFLPSGLSGLARALPPLFFAYAAFEALAHTGAEVRDSRRRLPRVFLRGIAATTVIFVSMTVVAFGVLPGDRLSQSDAPMATAAAAYLPAGAAALVALGGVLAVATSLNATMLVPARLALVLAADGFLPRWLGGVHAERGTPVPGLLATFAIAAGLLLSGQMALALNVAVQALVVVYGLHSLALLCLPARNPELFARVSVPIAPALQRAAAVFSLLSMGTLFVVQVMADVARIARTTLGERLRGGASTSLELLVLWGAVGLALHHLMRRRRRAAAGGASGAPGG